MKALPMFPLSTVMFPLGTLQLHVFEERYQRLVADCLATSGELGVVLIARGSEVGGGDQRYGVATACAIERASPLPGGRWHLGVRGTRRIRVTEWLDDDPYPLAMVADWPDIAGGGPGSDGAERPALDRALSAVRQARALASELGRGAPLPVAVASIADPDVLGWRLCDAAPLSALDRQRLLETGERGPRLELLASLAAEVAEDMRQLLTAS